METQVKKRGWVKNAIIIFLLIMLVLTLFSNTIMNYSLPEVSAQYAGGGSITTRIRGSGTVEAVETYNVKATQSRTVQSVPIRVGDQVEVGDVLLYLSGETSDELDTVRSELEALELAYQRALLQATTADYARQNRDIELARQDLEEAKAEQEELLVSDEAWAAADEAIRLAQENVTSAKAAVAQAAVSVKEADAAINAIQKELNAANKAVSEAEAYLAELGGRQEDHEGGSYAMVEAAEEAVRKARSAWAEAKENLAAKMLIYGEAYEAFYNYAEENRGDTPIGVYMKYLAEIYSQYTPPAPGEEDTRTPEQIEAYNQYEAYKIITEYEDAVSAAFEELDNAQTSLDNAKADYNASFVSGNVSEWNYRKKAVDDAQAAADAVEERLEAAKEAAEEARAAQTELEEAQTQAEALLTEANADKDKLLAQQESYKAAGKNIRSMEKNLEDLLFNLAEQQKTDGNAQALQALDLNEQKKQIERKREQLASLEGEGTGSTIVAQTAGTVKSISVSAGSTTQPDSILVSIEVTDRGYTLSFPVTLEQSRRVHVGDTAEITDYWWGQNINATLSSIRPDPASPQSSRLLCFDITGEIDTGTQLTLSIGQRSTNYDMVVPNSAIRSDTNGSFVLVIVAKPSPLGNRYVLQRADVTVITSDDSYSAVSGSLSNSDFVLTTSTKPVEPGMQVRMAD